MKGKKIDRKMIIAGIVIAMCLFITIVSVVISSAKQKNAVAEVNNYLSTDVVTTSKAELPDTDPATSAIVIEDVESDTDSDDTGLLPADCNHDFWQVKLGIAECYDHVFKGHMVDTAYYTGTCEKHESSDMQELAKKVKLLREEEDGENAYYAVLPEIGWKVQLFDENLKNIIDAQIAEEGPITEENIIMVIYFYDNNLAIEIAE